MSSWRPPAAIAIASYDVTGLARLMALRPVARRRPSPWSWPPSSPSSCSSVEAPERRRRWSIFEFIPAELIHDIGILVMVLVFAAGLLGIARMARRVGRREGVGWRDLLGRPGRPRAHGPRPVELART